MGQYEKAELLYLEAKAIREKVFGKEHPTYAQNISSLASLYLEMGQYEKAEPLYRQAMEIRFSHIRSPCASAVRQPQPVDLRPQQQAWRIRNRAKPIAAVRKHAVWLLSMRHARWASRFPKSCFRPHRHQPRPVRAPRWPPHKAPLRRRLRRHSPHGPQQAPNPIKRQPRHHHHPNWSRQSSMPRSPQPRRLKQQRDRPIRAWRQRLRKPACSHRVAWKLPRHQLFRQPPQP